MKVKVKNVRLSKSKRVRFVIFTTLQVAVAAAMVMGCVQPSRKG